MRKLLKAFLNGAVFGAVNVIPGVSGGTMLVIFGNYDIVCGALTLDFKYIKKHLSFLIPFAFGVAGGLLGAVFAATYLLEHFPVPTFLFFMGLICGSLPLIFGNLRIKEKPKAPHILLIIAALAFVTALGFTGEPEAAQTAAQKSPLLIAQVTAGGFLAATAMIIPGISGAFVLMLFGVYEIITTAVTKLDLFVLIPAGLGIIAGLVLGARAIKALLSRFYTATYSVITGFVLGSLFVIFPEGIRADLTLVIGLCTFIAGAVITFLTGRSENTEM